MNKEVVKLGGGLNTVASPLSMNPGEVIGSENYEVRPEGGYRSVGGYEAIDGRPKPSAAAFVVLGAASWGAGATVGALLTGATSLATGRIAYVSGTLLAVTKVTGAFSAGENVTVSAVVVGSSIALEPATTSAQDNAMHAAAAAIYRADIAAVPGEGPVCGHCVVNNVLYAFRNNVGSTKQEVWKATSSGWAAVTYPAPYLVGFTSGSGSYENGSVTVTKGGNTVVAHRVMIFDGTFAGGDAKGVLLLRTASTPGALTSGTANFDTGATVVLETGTSFPYQAVSLEPSGRWRFVPYQFALNGLVVSGLPVYGVDKTDSGGGNFIEFDGDILCPIATSGFPTLYPAPERLECHKDHAFVAIRNSIWFSGIGDPYSYTVFSGGGEVVIGAPITELMSVQGSEDQAAMLVCCADKTQVVYGNDSTDFQMMPLSRQVGAMPHTMQQIGGATLAFDQQGVRDFVPSQNFGNFSYNTLTDHIRPKVVGRTPTASVVDRAGGHYRVYFSDGTWLSGTPGKRWSWMFGAYPFTVLVASEWEIDGAPVMFVSGSDGFVYQIDIGRSFDGEPIRAWFKTAYAHLGSPGERKAFRRAELEVRSATAGTIQAQPDYSYGATTADQPALALIANGALTGSDGAFDLGAWDEGTWDAAYLTELKVKSAGVGENVSMLVYSEKDDELPHDFTAITHYYLPRRQSR